MRVNTSFTPTKDHRIMRNEFLNVIFRGNYSAQRIKEITNEYIQRMKELDKTVPDIELWGFLRDG
jgi:CTP:phosphocholine cytidylyltransferase-like protein